MKIRKITLTAERDRPVLGGMEVRLRTYIERTDGHRDSVVCETMYVRADEFTSYFDMMTKNMVRKVRQALCDLEDKNVDVPST